MSSWPRELLPVTFALLLVGTRAFIIAPTERPTGAGGGGAERTLSSPRSRRLCATMNTQDDIENYQGGDYKVFVGRGMSRFRSGRVAASIADFDVSIALQPTLAPYMWQRGLSLYYADRFEEGAKQFRKDIAVNPDDTEEAIWAFMCDARTEGVGFAAAQQRLLDVTSERRPYMRAAYSLFRGESKPSDLALQMEAAAANNNSAKAGAPYFYANLYLGLYSEATGDVVLARKYISAAVRSSYGKSGDYMYDVARVHQMTRGW